MDDADKIMPRVRELFDQSELTLDELGIAMGHESGVARRAAWQFLNKVGDPRISSLRKFCAAMGITLVDLFQENKKSRSK
jgi:transcriptional regulator with XRE-family HTH domain